MLFASFDQRLAVDISEECINQIRKIILAAGEYETGGILIGAYTHNQSTASIQAITGPPKDSKSGRTWFNRGTHGLKKLLDELWKNNLYYLGEWHFHPYATPTPSPQDKKQMKEIAASKQYHCPEPILLIIGGSYENYQIALFVCKQDGSLYELIKAS